MMYAYISTPDKNNYCLLFVSEKSCMTMQQLRWNGIFFVLTYSTMFLLKCEAIPAVLPFYSHDSTWSIYSDVDDQCIKVYLPFTVNFGTSRQTESFICSNGIILFEEPSGQTRTLESFPIDRIVVSPYWEDIYLKSTKGVYYKIFQNSNDLKNISNFLLENEYTKATMISVLIVKWLNVCPYGDENCIKGNSFQVAIITDEDGDESFAIFTYKCGELNWTKNYVTIGFSADDNFYANHFLSKKANVNDIACINQPQSVWSNVVYKLNIDVFPYIDLPMLSTLMDVDDSYISIALDNTVIMFGDENYSDIYISSNGLFSFSHSFTQHQPEVFPISSKVVSPYWDDIIIKNNGSLNYKVVTDIEMVKKVNNYLKSNQSVDFNASVVVIAKWNNVHDYGCVACSEKNSFQAIIATDESYGTYAVYTYKCGDLKWVKHFASIGFSESESFFANHPLSNSVTVNNVSCLNMPATNWSNIVYHISKILKITHVSDGLSVMKGDTITLHCEAFGNPIAQIEWSSDHSISSGVVTEEAHDHIVISRLAIEITKKKRFNCTASNNETVAVKTIEVFVQIPPAATISSETMNAIYGSYVLFSCSATGYPIPTIYWEKDNSTIDMSNIIETINTFEDNNTIVSSLSIDETTYENSGEYACYAENSLDLNMSNLLALLVFGKSKISSSQENINVIQDDNVTLECIVEGIPHPHSVLWYRNGESNDITSVVISQNESTVISMLYLPSVTLADAGEYICSAWNDFGKDNYTMNLRIQVIPTIASLEPHQIRKNYGDHVRISCVAHGYPIPDIYWTKNGEMLLDRVSNAVTTNISINSTVDIIDGTYNDNGEYICHAMNELTKTSFEELVVTTLKISPLLAKIVNNNPAFVILVEGATLNLSCSIHGRPKPIVQWYKENTTLREASIISLNLSENNFLNMLIIYSISSNNSGSYVCVLEQSISENQTLLLNSSSTEVIVELVGQHQSDSVTLPISIGGAVIVATLIVIALVVCVIKYRKMSHRNENTEEATTSNEQIMSDSIQTTHNVVYGLVRAPRRNMHCEPRYISEMQEVVYDTVEEFPKKIQYMHGSSLRPADHNKSVQERPIYENVCKSSNKPIYENVCKSSNKPIV